MTANVKRYTFENVGTGDFHTVYAISAPDARKVGDLGDDWRLVDTKPMRKMNER